MENRSNAVPTVSRFTKPLGGGLTAAGIAIIAAGIFISNQDVGSCPANTRCFHTLGMSGIYAAPLGWTLTSIGLISGLAGVTVLLSSKKPLGRNLWARTNLLILVAGLGLMLLSALNAEHVVAVDYEAVNYGYPMPWLVHYLAGIVPVNIWLPNVIGILVDYAVWVLVSALIVATVSLLRKGRRPVLSIGS